jgi:uroporphyrin-III C-methyltransferase / precorrin-2 dehydrogenase / sirohydrochlorin ferrochelatase
MRIPPRQRNGRHVAYQSSIILDRQKNAAVFGGSNAQVALIGCGPGDPELLTLRAQKRIAEAEVLVVDRLVNLQTLSHARGDAERIYVGKAPGGRSTPQEEINAILVREAKAGKRVARLKGGDPFVFGRAVEEMTALDGAGISFEVVPGVTAALACAASIALPVTARGQHRSFTMLTGATADGQLDHDWAALARAGEAFGVYMGVRTAGVIVSNLLNAGIDPDTPVIVVENGTMPNERSFRTDVANLKTCVKDREIEGPSLIYIGLDWDQVGLTKPDKVRDFDADAPGKAKEKKPVNTHGDRAPLWTAS